MPATKTATTRRRKDRITEAELHRAAVALGFKGDDVDVESIRLVHAGLTAVPLGKNEPPDHPEAILLRAALAQGPRSFDRLTRQLCNYYWAQGSMDGRYGALMEASRRLETQAQIEEDE